MPDASTHAPTAAPAGGRTRLDTRSRELRRLVFRGLSGAGRGHPGAALSLVEILRVLYDDVLRVRPREPDWPERDRFVLSKGHGCLGLYAVLADHGFFPAAELDRFCAFDGILGGHPERGPIPGVEASTGALGHGLSIGVGMAIAAGLRDARWRVFVLLGDGELGEGAVWEAAMTAAQHRLSRLCVIVDRNRMQSYGSTAEVLDVEPLADKLTAFGFVVREVDGHDVEALREAFSALPLAPDRPSALVCHTVKGRGVPDAEGDPAWHHKRRLTSAELDSIERALAVPGTPEPSDPPR